jgi:hypothetical protein
MSERVWMAGWNAPRHGESATTERDGYTLRHHECVYEPPQVFYFTPLEPEPEGAHSEWWHVPGRKPE